MTAHAGLLSTHEDAQRIRLADRWTDVFRSDVLIHLALMASIAAATLQGYLKDRISGPLPYALADLCFMTAAALWFGSLVVRHEPMRGPGKVPMLLLAIAFVPALYLLYPSAPLAIQLAGLRSWVEFPVGCLIALTVIRTPGQVRAYVGLILLLSILTAVYGIRQYQLGPEGALNIGDLAQMRHGSSTFYFIPGTGRTGFRAFSTFTFPAPFAMMMVFGILLAMGIVAARTRSASTRWLAALLVPIMFLGMTVSGTRAALVILIGGLGFLAYLRRLSAVQIMMVPLLLLVFHLASIITSGGSLERFQTLADESLFWRYVSAPITIAGRALAEHPFGLGLGRSGVGVPFQMFVSQPRGFFVGSDGDVGRAAVEMGIVGLFLLGLILFGVLPYTRRAAQALADSENEDLALGIVPLLLATGLGVLVGSPFASAPHGIMWWVLLGAVVKLGMMAEEERRAAEAGGDTGDEGRGTRDEETS